MRCLTGLAVVLVSALAQAQNAPAPPKSNPNQPFIFSRGAASQGPAASARRRARSGDCAGALDWFDEALKTSIEPELRRDRGLCHEQLGHPFPAIDDYRAYLRDRPNAPDSDQIRERLGRLEEQQGVGGRSNPQKEQDKPEKDKDKDKDKEGATASASLSINGEGMKAESSSSSSGSTSGKKSASQADFDRDEKLAAAASGSPLREASGWVLGPYFGVRQSAAATSDTLLGSQPIRYALGVNETLGAAIRYSFSPVSTILTEVGWVGFNDNHVSGLGLFGGYEARFAITKYTTDAIILGFGLGYERYRLGDTGDVMNNLMPRARLGYRHVFGESIGLEVHGDGGLGYYWLNGSDVKLKVAPVFGVYVALVVGF